MKNSLKYTCIFGGGAVRGISYVGAVKALREFGVEIDSVAGSSVGALFAILYALDYSCDEMKEIFLNFNFNMFKDINFPLGPDFAFSKGEVFLNFVRDLIEKKYYGDSYIKGENAPVNFSDIEKDLYILTCDLSNNTPFVFSKNNTPDFEVALAVRISASLPGLMKPTEVDDKFLVDGDLIKSWPLWKTDVGLCGNNSRILEFRLEGCRDSVVIKNPLDYLNTVFSSFSNFCTENIIETYQKNDKFDYILIDTKNVLLIDFTMPVEKRLELIQNGYDTTVTYFKEHLLNKKKNVLPKYKYVKTMLVDVERLLVSDQLEQSKNKLYELMANMYESLKFIDECVYYEINEFKKDFIPDIKNFLFFKKMHPVSKTKHIKKLNSMIENLQMKCDELSEYIRSCKKSIY